MATKVEQPAQSWSYFDIIPFFAKQPKIEIKEAPIPEKKGIIQRFSDFSDMQKRFIQEQPLLAAIYMLAAVFFGFPHLLSFNPFGVIYGALTIYFGVAIAWCAWNNEGISSFVGRVIAECKSFTAKSDDSNGDKSKSKTASSAA